MRVRQQDENGDYLIGQGEVNFFVNSPAGVGQTVETRLGLWEGQWFLDNTIYTPWLQQVLGYSTAALRDLAIKTVILDTDNVVSILDYSSSVDPETRTFTVVAEIMTSFGPTTVTSVQALPANTNPTLDLTNQANLPLVPTVLTGI